MGNRQSKKFNKGWTRVNIQNPSLYNGFITQFNSHEFIFATLMQKSSQNTEPDPGIYKYDSNVNQHTIFCKYPQSFLGLNVKLKNIVFDLPENILYLYVYATYRDHMLISFSMESKRFTVIEAELPARIKYLVNIKK